MKFDFDAYKPDRTEKTYELPIEGAGGKPVVLLLRHAGTTNKAYFSAVTKRSAARANKGGKVTAERIMESMRESVDKARDIFPRHVVVSWHNVVDSDGNVVPYSTEACLEFFLALPDWIVSLITNFAENPMNFIEDDQPSPREIEERAGN